MTDGAANCSSDTCAEMKLLPANRAPLPSRHAGQGQGPLAQPNANAGRLQTGVPGSQPTAERHAGTGCRGKAPMPPALCPLRPEAPAGGRAGASGARQEVRPATLGNRLPRTHIALRSPGTRLRRLPEASSASRAKPHPVAVRASSAQHLSQGPFLPRWSWRGGRTMRPRVTRRSRSTARPLAQGRSWDTRLANERHSRDTR